MIHTPPRWFAVGSANGSEREAGARAADDALPHDDAKLLILRRDDFRRRVAESPAVAWAMLVELSRRLRRADEQIGSLVLLDIHGRIARLLLDAADEGGASTITKPLTHQTIAQMIGASRETVSRAMREFQDRGLISVERRQITIADRGQLEQMAHVRV